MENRVVTATCRVRSPGLLCPLLFCLMAISSHVAFASPSGTLQTAEAIHTAGRACTSGTFLSDDPGLKEQTVSTCTKSPCDAPFQFFRIALEMAATYADHRLSSWWTPGQGVSLLWNTPFYLGELELRGELLPLDSRQSGVPSLNTVLTTAGWYHPLLNKSPLTVSAGLSIGNLFMYRQGEGPFEGPESEFSAEAGAFFRYRLTQSLSIRVTVRQTRVYTWHRIDMTRIGAGLEVRFPNPPTMVRFLK